MDKIVVASGNKHKLREIAEIFKGYEIVAFAVNKQYGKTGFFKRLHGRDAVNAEMPENKAVKIHNGQEPRGVYMKCLPRNLF